MRQILESIRNETMLTKERAKPANAPATPAAPAASANVPALLFGKSLDGPPGTRIEAQFKAYHEVLEGDATRRPIDTIIATLNDIAQNLTLITENPQMAPQVVLSLQNQVAALRNNASRMPPPFSDMMRRSRGGNLEGNLAASTAGQLLVALRDQNAGLPADRHERYPFIRSSDCPEVPLAILPSCLARVACSTNSSPNISHRMLIKSRPEWVWRL